MNTPFETYDLVVGLGKSGRAMACFLNHLGRHVVATDLNPDLSHVESELNSKGIHTQIGFHDQEVFNRAENIYMSPGIPPQIPYVKAARQNHVPVSGELDIFSAHNTTPVVAVTGTNGKTTTTSLIGSMLEASGKSVFTGGNIGTPMVEALMSDSQYQVMVLEISSFQLDISNAFTPEIAVLLNIAPDHMDRYPTFDDYAKSKWSIFKNQKASHTAIFNSHIPVPDSGVELEATQTLCFPIDPAVTQDNGAWFDRKTLCTRLNGQTFTFDLTGSGLRGSHNRENLAAAALAALSAGATVSGIQQVIREFTPMAHRMEYVATINAVEYYNDSKATNPDAVIRAIQCFETNVILIMGGREKDTEFEPIRESVRQSVKTILAIGEAAPHIKAVFADACTVLEPKGMKAAVETACQMARPHDTVLLAPACASFDMYDNYQARGDDFKKTVKEIEQRA